tara:strand:+ start:849 stop:1049 length:201 start_codon:yes stop_codon:yes gene_type:complete
MSQSKKETATIHLRHVRQELKEIHTCLNEEGLLPEPGELKALLSQMEALLDVLNGVKKKPAPVFPD